MKSLVTIGNFHIPFFGIMIAIGMITALFVIRYEAERKGKNPDKLTDMSLWGILGGMVGGRIGYILFYGLDQYLANPIEIIKIYNGGLSIHGGILGGALAILLYIRKNRELKVLEIADIVTPALILGQAIGRIGCDVYGSVMLTPRFWGVPVNGNIYHPVQVYEFILNYLLFTILWIKRDRLKYKGQLFGYYLVGFAVNRSFVELFRLNPQVLGFISVSHLLSIILILLGILWLSFIKMKDIRVEPKESLPKIGIAIWVKVFLFILISIMVYYSVQLNL
jgi:phosphatidylglycerol:prolipoprotein diacylglycerol transferase